MKKILSMCALLFFLPADAQTPKTFVVSIVNEGRIVAWYKNYITKAYTDLGYRIVYKALPPGRGHLEAQKGYLDALAIRVSAVESSFPSFIRIPVLLAHGRLMLYCQIDVPCNTEILHEQRYVIGIVSGSNITNVFMNGKPASVYEVVDGVKLAEIFNKKRLDYMLSIDSPDFGNYVSIDSSKFSSVSLASIEAYHYVHKKHLDKVPEIASALTKAINEIGPISAEYLEHVNP